MTAAKPKPDNSTADATRTDKPKRRAASPGAKGEPHPTGKPKKEPGIAVALGSGGARGLAHIPALEVFDELGVRPTAICGCSMGAIIGAAYCAGLSGAALREHMLALVGDRGKAMSLLVGARVGRLTDMFSSFGNPLLVDALHLLEAFWPKGVPDTFEGLSIPLQTVATDYFARLEVVHRSGALRPAVAASMAIPGLIRPVEHEGRMLIDGGATNPLPFEYLDGLADIVVAIDVATGPPPKRSRTPPGGIDISIGTIQIMQEAIVNAKLRHFKPEILLRPDIGPHHVLDFFAAKAIFASCSGFKDDLKRTLDAAFAARASSA